MNGPLRGDHRLLTIRPGIVLAVMICPFCASLVVEDGQAQHERAHRAALGYDTDMRTTEEGPR